LLSERSEAPMRKAGLELLRARAGESILEIGFGTGHSLVSLAKAVGPKGTVFGLDLSDKMLQRAKIESRQVQPPRTHPAALR
jgi:ubiquinone/menaquinone biosynthesis C-methylase UbiE